jgi:hypothetical protein
MVLRCNEEEVLCLRHTLTGTSILPLRLGRWGRQGLHTRLLGTNPA